MPERYYDGIDGRGHVSLHAGDEIRAGNACGLVCSHAESSGNARRLIWIISCDRGLVRSLRIPEKCA